MLHRVRLARSAVDEIERLPGHVRQRIRRLVDVLASDPRPARAKELRGRPGRYRIPLEDWRVIYDVDDRDSVVLILTVRRKRGPETYADLI